MRCFVAIDIDRHIRAYLGRIQKGLQSRCNLKTSDVKWVEPGNMHLTLKFLSEIDDAAVVEVCRILAEIAARHSSFSIDFAGIGTFGRSARVVSAGTDQSEPLVALHGDIDRGLGEMGFAGDKRAFAAHLTLCRIKNSRAAAGLTEAIKNLRDVRPGNSFVDSLCLYKSDLTKAGPIYTLLSRNQLQQG